VKETGILMPVSHVSLFRQTSNKSRKLLGSDTYATPACTARWQPKISGASTRNIIIGSAQLTPFGPRRFCSSVIYTKYCREIAHYGACQTSSFFRRLYSLSFSVSNRTRLSLSYRYFDVRQIALSLCRLTFLSQK